MTPVNDNDPGRHAGNVLRHILKSKPNANTRISVGLGYARSHDPAPMDETLSIAGADVAAVARAVLREGKDLKQAGLTHGPYKTEIQARAWAAAKLGAALDMLCWHPQRIELEAYTARLVERCKVLSAQNRSLISKLVA